MIRSKRHSKRLFNRKVQELYNYWNRYAWCPSVADLEVFNRGRLHAWYERHVRIVERVEYYGQIEWE